MKLSIEGFNQKYAVSLNKTILVRGEEKTIRIDCTDLVILRWFVDFYPKMKKMNIDGEEYAWLSYQKLIQDLPLINISKRSFGDRLHKLVEFNILSYKLIKENGTFTVYGFGENYENLVSFEKVGGCSLNNNGSSSNNNGVVVQTATKDNILKDNLLDNKEKENSKLFSKESDFERFWNEYPKKVDKAKCYKKFLKIKTPIDEIMSGLERYKHDIEVSNKDRQYIKNPLSWLNGECWNDEYENTNDGGNTKKQKGIWYDGVYYQ